MAFCKNCGRQLGRNYYCTVCGGEGYDHKKGTISPPVNENQPDEETAGDSLRTEITGEKKAAQINKYINEEEETLAEKMALSLLPGDDDYQYIEPADRPKVKVFDEELPEVNKTSVVRYLWGVAGILFSFAICWGIGFRGYLPFFAIILGIGFISIISLYYFARLFVFKTKDLYTQKNLLGQFEFWKTSFCAVGILLTGFVLFAFLCWLFFR